MKRSFVLSLAMAISLMAGAQKNDLDYFLKQGLSNIPLLKDFQGQRLSLGLDSQLILAALRPQVNGISNNSYAPVIHGYGYDEAITNGAQLSALISVSKSLFTNKNTASQIAGLGVQSNIAANNIKISEQDITKAITDQYIITYGGQLQLDFNNEIAGLLKKEDSVLKKLAQNNVYKQTDYLSFLVLLQQHLLNISQLEMQYKFDYALLNYLAGITDTTITPLPDPKLDAVAPGDFTGSVFYRQFVLDSLKLQNDRDLIGLTYRPKVNVFADAGYNSSLAYTPYKNFGTSAGINIAIPVYDGKQKKLQYSKLDIQERIRISKRDYFIQQHDQQLLQLRQQLQATDRLVDQINNQIRYTETLIRVNEKLLATGDIRLTDFILSLNNYFTARNLVTQNYISRLKIVNQINYWKR